MHKPDWTGLNKDEVRPRGLSPSEKRALIEAGQVAKGIQKSTGRAAMYVYFEGDRMVARPMQFGDAFKS